jgi:hypothetical protein
MGVYNRIFMSGPDGEKQGNLWNAYQSMVQEDEEVDRLAAQGIKEEDDPEKFISAAYANFQSAYPEDWKERLQLWHDTSSLVTKVDSQERRKQFAKMELAVFRYVRFPSIAHRPSLTSSMIVPEVVDCGLRCVHRPVRQPARKR